MSDHMRVSNQIIQKPGRKLPAKRGASNNKALGTSAPTLLNQAMGITGTTCMLSVAVRSVPAGQVTLTLWLWIGDHDNDASDQGQWYKAGANSTQYSKAYDSNTVDGWNVPEKTPFYIQSSAEVDYARVDAEPFAGMDPAFAA